MVYCIILHYCPIKINKIQVAIPGLYDDLNIPWHVCYLQGMVCCACHGFGGGAFYPRVETRG